MALYCCDALVAFQKKPLTGAMLDEPISRVVWSPDGKLLAVSTEAGDVAVFGV